MKIKTGLIVIFLFQAFLPWCRSQATDFPNDNTCYDPLIRTIQLFREDNELSDPVIQLNTDDRLTLRFDDLAPDIRRYKFTFRHCEAGWSTSADLPVSDYIDGFREENIDQFSYSYNTTIRYIHYEASFPTGSMKPKLSGNYLLIVYEEDPSLPVFTLRFMVVESTALSVIGNIAQSAEVASRYSRQQIDFVIRLNGFTVRDVEREIRVAVKQNGRTDNVLYLSKPRFARSDELDYRFDEAISFNGGNQFRYFDTKSLQYQSERIERIIFDTATQVFLLPDLPRTYKQYVFEEDLNGRFFIKNEDHAEHSATEADYAWVHFRMPWPEEIRTGSFHVLGELTCWQADNRSMMQYNPAGREYELDLLLKQGYYNYVYVLKLKGKINLDESFFEGNHWETENDYTVLVYYREAGSLYDRLLSVATINAIRP